MALLNIFTVWGQKETLKFNQNRTFKIVQFTDVHYKYDDQVNSQVALDLSLIHISEPTRRS